MSNSPNSICNSADLFILLAKKRVLIVHLLAHTITHILSLKEPKRLSNLLSSLSYLGTELDPEQLQAIEKKLLKLFKDPTAIPIDMLIDYLFLAAVQKEKAEGKRHQPKEELLKVVQCWSPLGEISAEEDARVYPLALGNTNERIAMKTSELGHPRFYGIESQDPEDRKATVESRDSSDEEDDRPLLQPSEYKLNFSADPLVKCWCVLRTFDLLPLDPNFPQYFRTKVVLNPALPVASLAKELAEKKKVGLKRYPENNYRCETTGWFVDAAWTNKAGLKHVALIFDATHKYRAFDHGLETPSRLLGCERAIVEQLTTLGHYQVVVAGSTKELFQLFRFTKPPPHKTP